MLNLFDLAAYKAINGGGGVTPEGIKYIYDNGTYDVSNYQYAEVSAYDILTVEGTLGNPFEDLPLSVLGSLLRFLPTGKAIAFLEFTWNGFRYAFPGFYFDDSAGTTGVGFMLSNIASPAYGQSGFTDLTSEFVYTSLDGETITMYFRGIMGGNVVDNLALVGLSENTPTRLKVGIIGSLD